MKKTASKTKKTAKKAKATAVKAKPSKAVKSTKVGVVTHFYGHLKVGIIKFTKPVKLGTEVRFKGATTDFAETISSMQYDHKPIAAAPKGEEVGVKVNKRVREGDKVFLA